MMLSSGFQVMRKGGNEAGLFLLVFAFAFTVSYDVSVALSVTQNCSVSTVQWKKDSRGF
jgi:hypothetical protein